MKIVSALYRSLDTAESVLNELKSVGGGVERADIVSGPDARSRAEELGVSNEDLANYGTALDDGDSLVVAKVDDETMVLADEIMRRTGDGIDVEALKQAHGDDQLIAPAGEPAAAVGATSTIGAADDGRTTYRDPMKPRE